MITSIWAAWSAFKSLRIAVAVIGVVIFMTTTTVAIKSYINSKVMAEEGRRKSEIDTAITAALSKANVTQLQAELETLSKQIATERVERQRVDQELQELRVTTERSVQRIQRRQSQLSKMLLDKPVETAAELSSEYNDLNRSLK